MATSPSKPEFGLPLQTVSAVTDPKVAQASVRETTAPGRDALQALLAFSSLHEQIRQRRVRESGNAQESSLADESPDELVLYEVLQLVAERALALTGADGVAIALVQEGEIICRAATGAIAPDIGARLDPDSGISGACFRSGKVVRCDDTENDARVDVQASRRLNTRSMLAVPLCGRRSVVGLLEAFSTDAYGFNDSDVRSLTLLGELILGAMKPEEEERLEALSPVLIKKSEPVRVIATKTIEEKKEHEEPKPVAPMEEPEAPAELGPLAQEEIAPALFEQESGFSSRPGMLVVMILVAVALLAAGAFWYRLHTKTNAVAAVAQPPAAEPAAIAKTEAIPAGTVEPAAQILQSSPVSSEDAQRNVYPSVTGIRHWESGDSTTVVIDLQDQVQYEVHRLSSPERIYFDLHDTVLAPGLNGKTIEVGDALLLRIRVAQPMSGISRVVLETKDVSNFSVSLASNPYRLVAEIRSAASSSQPKARFDFLHPEQPTERAKIAASMPPISKEDVQLRAHVPHMRIVVDAGHGGWDLGTVGRKGLLEKNLVLDVAQRLGDLLENRLGCEVIYTRDDDTYVPLEKRAEVANEAQADLFVSVHANYSDLPSARGVETYYTNFSASADSLDVERRENATASQAAQTGILTGVTLKDRTEQSRRLAASVERALYGMLSTSTPGIRDRGVKEARFVVLTGTAMPAILAEVSFVSSPMDEENLQSSSYREQIADALYKGIARYASLSSHVKMASASGKPTGR